MKVINTQPYMSTVREFNGFTSLTKSKSEVAIDFDGLATMTLNSCLSHLFNNQVIDYKTKKSYIKKSDDKKIELINKHKNSFVF